MGPQGVDLRELKRLMEQLNGQLPVLDEEVRHPPRPRVRRSAPPGRRRGRCRASERGRSMPWSTRREGGGRTTVADRPKHAL